MQLFDFKEEMRQEIRRKLRPLMREYELRPGRGISFVRECDGLIQRIDLLFTRTDLYYCAAILPLYDAFCASGDYSGVPLQVYETEQAQLVKRNHPSAFASWEEHKLLCAGDLDTAERCRARAMNRFEQLTEFFQTELLPCFHEIDTYEKYLQQVQRNLTRIQPARFTRPESAKRAGDYIFGVRDCLRGNYDTGLERLRWANAYAVDCARHIKTKRPDYDMNQLKHNDSGGRFYKFCFLFVEALESGEGREQRFSECYERVCQEMRLWHRLIKTVQN